jgi:hypothetical protein
MTTTSSSPGTTLAVILVPPAVGLGLGALLAPKHRWLGALAGGVLGGVAVAIYEYSQQSPAPAASPSQPATAQMVARTVTSWHTGQPYILRAAVPPNAANLLAVANALVAAGWDRDPYFLWYGPTGYKNALAPPDWVGDPGLYVAYGTWGGADNTPVPPGIDSRTP